MSLAACLLAYSMVVAVLGPPLLARATRSGAAPRLGMIAWSAAMGSIVLSWALAGVLLTADLVRGWGRLDQLLAGCFATLQAAAVGGHGGFLQAVIAVVTATTVLALAVLALRVGAGVRRARTHSRRHAEAAVLAARGAARGPGGSVVLEVDQRSVYCLAGRPATIVITSGALAALADDQLAAVLDHEHAHLAGSHHQLLRLARALARTLPGMRLFTDGAVELARLAEMRADDAAAQRHGADTVVGALLALAAPGLVSAPEPALGAAGVGVADRVERLLFPPTSTRLRFAAILAGLLVAPVIAAALVITQSPLCITALG